jgi:hypothetical protein
MTVTYLAKFLYQAFCGTSGRAVFIEVALLEPVAIFSTKHWNPKLIFLNMRVDVSIQVPPSSGGR